MKKLQLLTGIFEELQTTQTATGDSPPSCVGGERRHSKDVGKLAQGGTRSQAEKRCLPPAELAASPHLAHPEQGSPAGDIPESAGGAADSRRR